MYPYIIKRELSEDRHMQYAWPAWLRSDVIFDCLSGRSNCLAMSAFWNRSEMRNTKLVWGDWSCCRLPVSWYLHFSYFVFHSLLIIILIELLLFIASNSRNKRIHEINNASRTQTTQTECQSEWHYYFSNVSYWFWHRMVCAFSQCEVSTFLK